MSSFTAAVPSYDIGDGVRCSVAFRDINGVPRDPDGIVFKLLDPTGNLTTPAIVRTGTGLYYADFVITPSAGTWSYRWEGTGAVTAAEEGKFTVSESAFPL